MEHSMTNREKAMYYDIDGTQRRYSMNRLNYTYDLGYNLIEIGGDNMNIKSDCIVSVTEANQNFSRVTRIADRNGEAIIFKNNRPKYKLIDLDQEADIALSEDEAIDIVAARILKRYKPAFVELAK